MRNTLISKGIGAALLVPAAACAQAPGSHMMRDGYGMFRGPVWLIVGLAAAVAIALLLVRWTARAQSPPAPSANTPLDILKERFARGEIDKAEYEDRHRSLEE